MCSVAEAPATAPTTCACTGSDPRYRSPWGPWQDPSSTDASLALAHLCPSSITQLPGSLLPPTAHRQRAPVPLTPAGRRHISSPLNPPVPASAPKQPLLSECRIGASGTTLSPKSLCARQPYPGRHEVFPQRAPLGRSSPLPQDGIRARPGPAFTRSGHSDLARGRGDVGHGTQSIRPGALQEDTAAPSPIHLLAPLQENNPLGHYSNSPRPLQGPCHPNPPKISAASLGPCCPVI